MPSVPALRPLEIGEALDRSLHVVLRHWKLVLVIGVVLDAPAVAFAFHQNVVSERTFLAQLRGMPTRAEPPGAGLALAIVAGILATSLEYAAALAVAAGALGGERPTLAASMRAALARWPVVLAFTVLQMCVAVLAMLAAFVGFAVTLYLTRAAGLSLAFAAIPALLCALPFVWPFLVLALAEVTVSTERAGVLTASKAVLRRLASRGRFGRTLAVACVAAAVVAMPAFAAEAAGIGSLAFEPIGVLANAFALAGQVTGNALCAALLATHAVDLRVRAEGYDLASAIPQAAGGETPAR